MSNLGSSIVRGMGYTIGRNIVNSVTRSTFTQSNGRTKTSHYTNKEINDKMGVDINDTLQEWVDDQVESAQILKTEYTSKEKNLSSMGGIIFYFSLFFMGDLFLPYDAPTGAWALIVVLLGWIPFLIVRELIKKFVFGKNRIVRYDERIEEIKKESILKAGVLVNLIEMMNEKYGEDVTDKLRNRRVEKGLPMEGFTGFFGKPNHIEETDKFVTYIYGTSKRVGDWFRFKDNSLVEFSIK
jgi:hypothetical protein